VHTPGVRSTSIAALAAPSPAQTRWDHFAQIDEPRLLERSGPDAQLQHQVIHPSDDVLHGGQHVALEFRIVPVALRIAEHQRELRHQVLEVVNDEGRHPIECIEFARLQKRLGGLDLTQ
jgi:hypothetical protein